MKSPKNTLYFLLDSPLLTIDPLMATDAASQRVGNLVHSALVARGADLQPKPDLAESWKINENKIRLRLRPDLHFQDGSPLKAEDVVVAVKLFAGLAGSSAPQSRHIGMFSKIAAVGVVDPLTVEIETKDYQPYFIHDLYLLKIIKPSQGKLISAGRFTVETREPWGVILRRWSGYYEKPNPAAIDRMVIRYVRDDTTRYQQFMRGNIDLLPSALSISKSIYLQKQNLPKIKITNDPGISLQYIAFNFKNKYLSNVNVRKAIAHGINIRKIIEHRYPGFTIRAKSLLSPLLAEYEPDLPDYPYDPNYSQSLLEKAGFLRAKNGWRFEINYKTSPSKEGLDLARIVAADLSQIGIKVNIQSVELATLLSDLKAGRYEMYSSRWVGIVDPSIYFRLFHSSEIGNLNRCHYKNSTLDAKLAAALGTHDDRTRRQYFRQVQRLVAEDLPYITLWHWTNTLVSTTRLQNLKSYPNGDFLPFAQIVKE